MCINVSASRSQLWTFQGPPT